MRKQAEGRRALLAGVIIGLSLTMAACSSTGQPVAQRSPTTKTSTVLPTTTAAPTTTAVAPTSTDFMGLPPATSAPVATTTPTTNPTADAAAQQELRQQEFAQMCNTPATYGDPNAHNPDGLQVNIDCPVGSPAYPYIYGYAHGPITTVP